MIKILYFGSVREQVGRDHEELEFTGETHSLKKLKYHLSERGNEWKILFEGNTTLICAINQNVAQDNALINDWDEVAFFPPVTGG